MCRPQGLVGGKRARPGRNRCRHRCESGQHLAQSETYGEAGGRRKGPSGVAVGVGGGGAYPNRLRNPNVSISIPKNGYLRNTSAMPPMKHTAASEGSSRPRRRTGDQPRTRRGRRTGELRAGGEELTAA